MMASLGHDGITRPWWPTQQIWNNQSRLCGHLIIFESKKKSYYQSSCGYYRSSFPERKSVNVHGSCLASQYPDRHEIKLRQCSLDVALAKKPHLVLGVALVQIGHATWQPLLELLSWYPFITVKSLWFCWKPGILRFHLLFGANRVLGSHCWPR